ncbi:MAG: hypothetical protein ACLTBV_06740 [Enterocloster bolteae]
MFVEDHVLRRVGAAWAMKVVLEAERADGYRPGRQGQRYEADRNRRNTGLPADQDSRNRHGQ